DGEVAHVGADRHHFAGELVAGDDWAAHERIAALAIEQVAVADAAAAHAHDRLSGAGLGGGNLGELEPLEPARFTNDDGAHATGNSTKKTEARGRWRGGDARDPALRPHTLCEQRAHAACAERCAFPRAPLGPGSPGAPCQPRSAVTRISA